MQSGGEAVAGSEVNDTAKETPSVVSTHQSREVGSAEQQQSPQRTLNSSGIMVKQNGEEYDEGAQERMLKDESTQKIAKESTEVKIMFLAFLFVNRLSSGRWPDLELGSKQLFMYPVGTRVFFFVEVKLYFQFLFVIVDLFLLCQWTKKLGAHSIHAIRTSH